MVTEDARFGGLDAFVGVSSTTVMTSSSCSATEGEGLSSPSSFTRATISG